MNGEQVNNSHVEGAVGSAVLSAVPGDEQGVIAVMARWQFSTRMQALGKSGDMTGGKKSLLFLLHGPQQEPEAWDIPWGLGWGIQVLFSSRSWEWAVAEYAVLVKDVYWM